MELALSVVLTPLIMLLWGAIFPVRGDSEFQQYDLASLRPRNRWINNISLLLHFVGMFLPFPFLIERSKSNPEFDPWMIALIFGSMVLFPFLFITAITLPQGIKRFREYWRFYELHYGIGILGIKIVFIPIGLAGIISLWKFT